MNSKEIMQLEDEYISNVYPKRNIAIVKGQGALLWNADGKEYIDAFSSLWNVLIGHGQTLSPKP